MSDAKPTCPGGSCPPQECTCGQQTENDEMNIAPPSLSVPLSNSAPSSPPSEAKSTDSVSSSGGSSTSSHRSRSSSRSSSSSSRSSSLSSSSTRSKAKAKKSSIKSVQSEQPDAPPAELSVLFREKTPSTKTMKSEQPDDSQQPPSVQFKVNKSEQSESPDAPVTAPPDAPSPAPSEASSLSEAHTTTASMLSRKASPHIPRRFTSEKLKGVAQWEAKLLALVNATRAAHGVHPVRTSTTLGLVARRHNADQAFVQKGISHDGSDGSSIGDRLRRGGYRYAYAAENVAVGQHNPQHVHRSLMRSPGHARNVLSPEVRDMGLHVGRGADGRLYWTQVFGRRRTCRL